MRADSRRALGVLLLCTGCGAVGPTARFRSITANPQHDNRVMDDYTTHRNNPVYQDVAVVETEKWPIAALAVPATCSITATGAPVNASVAMSNACSNSVSFRRKSTSGGP